MRLRLFILIMLSLSTLCSCSGKQELKSFIQSEEIRLQIGKSIQFHYNPLNCQLGFNRDRKEFRASTDNMSDYYIIQLSDIPSSEGQSVTANLTWTTYNDVQHRNAITLEAVRLEGDKIWLWSSTAHIGVNIRVLE